MSLLYAIGEAGANAIIRYPVESTVFLMAVLVWQVVYVGVSLRRVARRGLRWMSTRGEGRPSSTRAAWR
jgi:hypothetical protein